MGIPQNRYSKITDKNQREICLLRSFPCAWGKCAFCDYTMDNGRDEEANTTDEDFMNEIGRAHV